MAEISYRDFPIYGQLQEKAPGFSLADIDKLMRQSWAEGFEAGARDMGPTINALQRQVAEGEARAERVVRSHLNHTVRRLRDQAVRPKTTIADDRHFMIEEADKLARAIALLEPIPAPSPLRPPL